MKIEMLILADDFTGALDTGIQFAKFGAKTLVITDTGHDFSKADVQVLVIDTETRHLPSEEAGRVIESIVRRAVASGITFFYKKTDSAMRGNAGAEMEALLKASGGKCVHFFPAFPAMNRVVCEGVLYIDGVPVAESVFGKDPFEPVRWSSVTEILAGQTDIKIRVSDTLSEDAEGIVVYNSETDKDILRLLSQLKLDRVPVLIAGCAGLASCLARVRPFERTDEEKAAESTKGLLIVSGSVNDVTRRQIRKAEDAGFAHAALTIPEKLSDYLWTDEGERARKELYKNIADHKWFVVDTADPPGGENALRWGMENGMDAKQVGSRIADTLSRIVKDVVERDPDRLLLLTGGDVLYHAMQVMGVTELEPLSEVSPGVILSLFRYKGVLRPVLTKSGGFGKEDLFVDLGNQYAPE